VDKEGRLNVTVASEEISGGAGLWHEDPRTDLTATDGAKGRVSSWASDSEVLDRFGGKACNEGLGGDLCERNLFF
jgi:hypothetical protein